MTINGKTRLIGLIGNPVEHTLSPVIHNGISEKMNIDCVYVPFKVETEGLDAAIKGAYELNVLGMNVTVPHKNDVIASLVGIDDCAKHIGAVNTLVRDEEKGGYVGYNTDMLGLRRQIHEDGINLRGRTVVILGAGGAAKAVVYMCLLDGADKVYLLNRTLDKAQKIADDMNKLAKDGAIAGANNSSAVIPCSIEDYADIREDNLIVFQATSIGLFPNVDACVLEDDTFYDKVEIGVDLIYNPAETKFMKLVKAHGGKAYNALKMLLYQGVIAYELWHKVTVDNDILEDIYVELKRKVYPKDNIVLIGFMGSGKTTFGKAIAEKLSMKFFDTDEYIEQRENMTIKEIFATKGEEGFRQIETDVLRELANTLEGCVVSTGGGMPLRIENARLLKEIGKVIYLNVATQVIYERVKEDGKRPLLQVEDPYDRICEMMTERKPLYERACDVIFDANCNDPEVICTSLKNDGII